MERCWVFAYPLVGGLAREVTERIVADLGHRFAATSEPDLPGLEEYDRHDLAVAIRISFW
jgi:hypothetical protein